MGMLRMSKHNWNPSDGIMLEGDNWLGDCTTDDCDCGCLSAQELQKPELMQRSAVLRILAAAPKKLPWPVLWTAKKLHLCAVRRAMVRMVLRFNYRSRQRRLLDQAI